jgi:hypothetical protein
MAESLNSLTKKVVHNEAAKTRNGCARNSRRMLEAVLSIGLVLKSHFKLRARFETVVIRWS